MTREEQRLLKKLKEVTEKNREFIWWLDKQMEGPSSESRGRIIATGVNAFQMYNDGVRYGWCGVDFRKDKPFQPKKARPCVQQEADRG